MARFTVLDISRMRREYSMDECEIVAKALFGFGERSAHPDGLWGPRPRCDTAYVLHSGKVYRLYMDEVPAKPTEREPSYYIHIEDVPFVGF